MTKTLIHRSQQTDNKQSLNKNKKMESNSQSTSSTDPEESQSQCPDDDVFFLPESLQNLVMKIAKMFEFNSFNEFSLMESLEYTILHNTLEIDDMDETKMSLLIINIIRLSEKFNCATSKITKIKLNSIFSELGFSNDEFNDNEFTTFRTMNFNVRYPSVVEFIYNFIETLLPELHEKKSHILEFTLDIMRLAYSSRQKIYDV